MAFLDIRDIKSGYRDKPVLENVSFSVKQGEFLALIGPNGAGKTTLLKTLTHIITPEAGRVFFKERDIHRMSASSLAKKFAIVTQDLKSIFSFTVKEIVLMGRSPYISLLGNETKNDIEIVDEVLRYTDLEGFSERLIDELSAGERQRVLIARALAQEPEVLLLDEPTAHLDIGYQTEILDLVRSLQKKKSLTVICVLHDLNLASQYSDRILLLDKGKVAGLDTPKEILKYETIEKVFKAIVLVNDTILAGKPIVTPISRSR